ncbi:antibiotic biosynthesis monooxygenase [Nocardia seriolae]|uniref:ABM domain-containing protein n=1 Tax=Nocardia seriolae TaxID=37332 RepID=A0A0B8NN60_9NOCA|nr:antibiotic biosynthesis monooxygenase [Nocardia seriolae]APA98610.1 hypothetical protein NS506_04562 [Nocardia seriolae]MTJ63691.1 hypothetical protein [Nocardia seriolae]MTJ75225.1 hypothetical protein [Nocardia seriolae]MTJ88258.1 hypothetical protein [Nocardia seriolae]MTK32246.1 hypothetical protein [Nocardia seriolae]
MPEIPWTKGVYQPEDGDELHVLTSELPLKRYGDIPRFLRWTLRIRTQLRDAPGCAGYSLDALLTAKTFRTLSAWSDKAAMEAFVRSGAHAEMLADMAGRVGNPRFVESTAPGKGLPLLWAEARARLAAPPD